MQEDRLAAVTAGSRRPQIPLQHYRAVIDELRDRVRCLDVAIMAVAPYYRAVIDELREHVRCLDVAIMALERFDNREDRRSGGDAANQSRFPVPLTVILPMK